MWQKQGLLLDGNAVSAFSASHAALPFALALPNDSHRLFFASRDAQSRSHVFAADLDFSTPMPTLGPVTEILSPGPLGAFDDSGAMISWAINSGNDCYLYYTGWALGKTVPFYNFIGLATSSGGEFTRVSTAPILGRSITDPYLNNSPCVLKEGNLWRMWYVSGQRWEESASGPKHYYHIRYAESADGIHWKRTTRPCIDFSNDDEYAIARPCVVAIKGGYLMWYSVRGIAYKIGFAASHDGISWKRIDDKAGIATGPTGWDSQMIAYAHVFAAKGKWWMLYNGNDYGKTGIGIASTERLPSISELL